MKLKLTFMTLLALAFSVGAYAQACCTGPGVSYPNGATTISYSSVESTTTSATSVSYVGDPNVIYMGSTTYSAPSTTTYTGAYTSGTTYTPSRSCCQGPAATYPTGAAATVTSYGTTTTTSTDYGIGAGDPNVIYMGGFTTTTTADTYIPTNTSSVGNSCCGGPGITYPGQASSGY